METEKINPNCKNCKRFGKACDGAEIVFCGYKKLGCHKEIKK